MRKPKHTLGPWQYHSGTERVFSEIMPVCKIISPMDTVGGSREATANAALIASAPDMLSALYEALEYVKAANGPAGLQVTLRLAIEKAEGKL